MNPNEMLTRTDAERHEKRAEQAEKRDDYRAARLHWNLAASLWTSIGWGPSAAKCATRAIYA